MKKNYYWIIGVVIIALLAFLKYDYDRKEKEKVRIEKLNNDVRNAAESVKQGFNEDLNQRYGKSLIDGLNEINVSGESK